MNLLIYHHLGLGDHFICHGIIRNKAARFGQVLVIAKEHNATTVAWMFSDLPNVQVMSVKDDGEAVTTFKDHRSRGWLVLPLGAHSGDPNYSDKDYDQHFYRHAQVPFTERWTNFIASPSDAQVVTPPRPFCLVHRDVRMDILPHVYSDHPIVELTSERPNLFDWWKVLHAATEIHCIPSSVYLLIDSLDPFPDIPLYLHKWCRGDVTYPTHRKNWIVLKDKPEAP